MSIALPQLNPSQQQAIKAITAFLSSAKPVFLLLGSAGTGKTTLVSHIIRLLDREHRPFQAVAPSELLAEMARFDPALEADPILDRRLLREPVPDHPEAQYCQP